MGWKIIPLTNLQQINKIVVRVVTSEEVSCSVVSVVIVEGRSSQLAMLTTVCALTPRGARQSAATKVDACIIMASWINLGEQCAAGEDTEKEKVGLTKANY